ncbi:hypothetical protein OG320_14335 [Microbispora sp. NBC_01189]|uniref:hypothetical protein n=1 Tax=Microbispora sp. NBC_01189 TaxID=2903583 RepID=UPI002E11DAA1|nr:hypothetical protein OG320_14335 [Microbispora sp. NBC_01189]
MDPEGIVTYRGRRYRMWNGRLLLDWAKPTARPVLRHRTGCLLCCDVRVTTGPGSPPRHPPGCTNCTAYRGPRPDPCRYCGKTAHLRDDDGHPVHKVCHEQAITTAILTDPEGQIAA